VGVVHAVEVVVFAVEVVDFAEVVLEVVELEPGFVSLVLKRVK